MKLLEERIKKDGKALGKTVLKVDSFINHQVDSEFMGCSGKRFRRAFQRLRNHKSVYNRKFRNCPCINDSKIS